MNEKQIDKIKDQIRITSRLFKCERIAMIKLIVEEEGRSSKTYKNIIAAFKVADSLDDIMFKCLESDFSGAPIVIMMLQATVAGITRLDVVRYVEELADYVKEDQGNWKRRTNEDNDVYNQDIKQNLN